MTKGFTGLGRKQLNRLVELVVGDEQIALAPRILTPLTAAGDADISAHQCLPGGDRRGHGGLPAHDLAGDRGGHPDPRQGPGPLLASAEQVPRTGVHIIDGTLLPCWSWKDQPCLFSGKHKSTGVNLQVMVGLGGRLRWACDPLPGSIHDARAIAACGILEEISPSRCIADKSCTGTGITAPDRKPSNGELAKVQKQANKALNDIRYVVERTIAHIKARKIQAHDYRRPLHTFKETITATLALHTHTNP